MVACRTKKQHRRRKERAQQAQQDVRAKGGTKNQNRKKPRNKNNRTRATSSRGDARSGGTGDGNNFASCDKIMIR